MKALNERLVIKQKEYLGYFSTIPSYAHHEGHEWTVVNQGGTENTQEYVNLGSEFSIKVDDVPRMGPQDILGLIDSAAEDSARKMHDQIILSITRSVDEAGTAIDAKGRTLSQDLFLQALDSMQLDFDTEGYLIPPTVIMHPKLWEAKKDEMKSWEQDPEFVRRHTALIDRKREEWSAREACRKLVD